MNNDNLSSPFHLNWAFAPSHLDSSAIRQLTAFTSDHISGELNADPFNIESWTSTSYQDPTFINTPTNLATQTPSAADAKAPSTTTVDKALELVHELLACAEAIGCGDVALASSILKRLWPMTSPAGDALRRVVYYFVCALHCRLALPQNTTCGGSPAATSARKEALLLLHQSTPFLAFGFLVANHAIYMAGEGRDRLHIIDLGMEHTLQWPPLLRALATRRSGAPHVRITALPSPTVSLAQLQLSMKSIADDSKNLGLDLDFHIASTSDPLQIKQGETLIINSMMKLHRYQANMLEEIYGLKPSLVTLVEQDANHNGEVFVGRFVEALHYYSAVFDAVEGVVEGKGRGEIERWYFGEEIRNVVAMEGEERVERHERGENWGRRMRTMGFEEVGVSGCGGEVREMLGVKGWEGYSVMEEKGGLVLGWKERPLVWASAWVVANGRGDGGIL